MDIVSRSFSADFIYFDLIFVCLWIGALLISKRFGDLLAGIWGFFVYFIVDYGIWYSWLGLRIINALPVWLTPITFLLYFSFTYGMVMFSFARIMFDPHAKGKMFWALGLFCGWLITGLLSEAIAWDESMVIIARDMTWWRWIEVGVMAVGFIGLILALYKWKPMGITWRGIGLLLGIGMFIHFCMEITLIIAGIRPWNLTVLILDTIIEFNEGIPIMYTMWLFTSHRDEWHVGWSILKECNENEKPYCRIPLTQYQKNTKTVCITPTFCFDIKTHKRIG